MTGWRLNPPEYRPARGWARWRARIRWWLRRQRA